MLIAAIMAGASSGCCSAALVATNAPQFKWTSRVDPSGVFAYRVIVASAAAPEWDSGWVYGENEPFPGIYVYDGPQLERGAIYNWTATELQRYPPAPGEQLAPPWVAGTGWFEVPSDLPLAVAEASTELNIAANFTKLAANALSSITARISPSGFMPTSVSGGYGGQTNMFVRDTCAMLLGLLEQGGAESLRDVGKVLNFTLFAIESARLDYAPHVMTADPSLSRVVSFDMADQVDGTMHLAITFARFLAAGGDARLGTAFYRTVARLLNHYAVPRSANVGGVPYFNVTLGLIFNPNLEHSRLGHYWSGFDVLTNTFAAEALRQMADVALGQNDPAQAAAWQSLRAQVLAGVAASLGYSTLNETNGAPIYAELIGGVHYWWPGNNNSYPPGNSTGPLDYIYGVSFVNSAIVAAFAAVLGSPRVPAAIAGLDVRRLENTLDTTRRLGSFLWITDDPAAYALMSMTHVNASAHTDPDRAVIGKGFGWELAAAAFSGRWVRVATLARWLGAAAANLTLYGESYFYDCLRTHQKTGCWGDMGNGEQTGWFVWGIAVARSLAASALET
jgi:hypothetical protein